MKKIIFSLAILVCIVSGCTKEDAEKCKCYKVNYTMANGVAMEEYRWMNKISADWQKSRYEELGYTDISIKHDIMKKSFAECWDSDTTTHLCGKQPGSVVAN